MLSKVQALERVHSLLGKALVLFVVNALIPPLALLVSARLNLIYRILWPTVIYEVACIASLLAFYMAREALAEYSFRPALKFMTIAGSLGLITGLVAGGVLVLKARSILRRAVASKV